MSQSLTTEEKINQLEAQLKSARKVTAFVLVVLVVSLAVSARGPATDMPPIVFGSTEVSFLFGYVWFGLTFISIPILTVAAYNSIMKTVYLIGRINRLM